MSMRFNRNRKNQQSSPRVEPSQEGDPLTSELARDSSHRPEATAKDGARRQIKEAEVQEAASPTTVMDAANSPKVPKPFSPPDERVKRKPIHWRRLRTLVLSPRRAGQRQKELRNRHEVATVNLTSNSKESTHSPSNAAPNTLSSPKQRVFSERGTAATANNSICTKDDVPGCEKGNDAITFEREAEQTRKPCLNEAECANPKRLQSNAASIPNSTNLHDSASTIMERSRALHVSVAYDDGSLEIGAPNGPADGRERGAEDHSLASRETAFEKPPVTGSWARLSGVLFSARINKGQSSETDRTVEKALKSKSSEDVQETGISLKRQEHSHMASFLRPHPPGKQGSSPGNGKSYLKVASMRSLGQARAKKKDSTDDDFESPWGVKGEFESGNSFEKEVGSRSFMENLSSIASRMNAGRTLKPSLHSESNNSSSDEPAEETSEQDEDGEKIEMFRDAFVEYSLRSTQGPNNRNLANKIRTGRRSTLAMFKE